MIDGHKNHFMESMTPIRSAWYHARSYRPMSHLAMTKRYNGYMSQFASLDDLMHLWNSIKEDNNEEKRDALSDLEYL